MPVSRHSVFTSRMPFLPPNQQHQSTDENMTKYFEQRPQFIGLRLQLTRPESVLQWCPLHYFSGCIEMLFGLKTWMVPRNHLLHVCPDHHWKRKCWGEGWLIVKYSMGTLCGELCKTGWTDRDAVCGMGSDGPKESCFRPGPAQGIVYYMQVQATMGKGHSAVSYTKMA